ncbi:MAG: hypothetical protein AAB706_03090 [Patescibacteria group bacterium]
MIKIKLIKLVFFFGALVVFSPLFAQLDTTQTSLTQTQEDVFNEQLQAMRNLEKSQIAGSVTITSTPNFPRPLQKVLLQLQSFGPDLNSSYITWRVNGSVKKAGNAEKTFEISVGKAGSVTNIQVIIEAQGMEAIEKNMVLQPADIDLVWEAQSYIPPFYKGKTLYAAQGKLVIAAIPYVVEKGIPTNAKNLIYKWSKDGKILGEVSGYGKNALTLYGSIISRPLVISVEVTSAKSSVKTSKTITIAPAQAKVLLYEINPLYGIQYGTAIGKELVMKNDELTLIASPYFFSIENKTFGKLTHKWTLNNRKIEEESEKNVITFKRPETVGVSQITLGIQSDNKILQSAQNTVLLKFEDKK